MLKTSKIFNFLYLNRERLSFFFSSVFALRHFRIFLFSALGINTILWLLTSYAAFKFSENLVILHYNVDFGVNLAGDKEKIYFLPVIGLLVVIFNFILAGLIRKRSGFLSILLLFTSLVSNFFLLAGLAFVYLINFT